MPEFIEELREWMDKYTTHNNRMRSLLLTLAALLVERNEALLLMEIGECMEDYGNDIIELMKILQQHAAKVAE